MANDLVEKLLSQLNLALPQHRLVGLAVVPPELVFVCYKRTDPRKASRFLVNHRYGATKEALHLIADPGMHSAAVAVSCLQKEPPKAKGAGADRRAKDDHLGQISDPRL